VHWRPLPGGRAVPPCRLGVALRHPNAGGVAVTEAVLRIGEPLLDSHAVPPHRLGVALCHNDAAAVVAPENELRHRGVPAGLTVVHKRVNQLEPLVYCLSEGCAAHGALGHRRLYLRFAHPADLLPAPEAHHAGRQVGLAVVPAVEVDRAQLIWRHLGATMIVSTATRRRDRSRSCCPRHPGGGRCAAAWSRRSLQVLRWLFFQSTFWHSLLQYAAILQLPQCLAPGLPQAEHATDVRMLQITSFH